ncbi:MAG: ABC transporter ATP-binding protein [Clostridia bacterium]|nr:ABC transporter ATP-binding protein [Clostridia bacterium]
MRKLFKFLKPYMLFTILAPLFMLLEVAMDLAQPMLMSRIIDVGVKNGDKAYIVWMSIGMCLCALIGIVGGVGNMYFSTKAGYGFARDLRSAVYRKIQSFSFANVDAFKTGSLITRTTNDVTQIQNAFTSCIRMLVRSPFLCIGGIVSVLMISPKISLVVLTAVPFLVILIVFLLNKGRKLFSSMQEKLDRVNTVMQESLSGIRVIKAFARSEHENNKFRKANGDLTEASMKAMRMMSYAFPMVGFIMNVTMILMYLFGGKMVFTGQLQPGEIMAFSNYITQILMSLTMSSFTLMFLSRAGVSFRRVNEVLDTKSDIYDGSNTDLKIKKGEVEFRNVSFSYPGQAGDPVLGNISFTAKPGETVAILGATGSGKSTLINLIPRLYDVTKGSVLIDGVDVRDYTLDNLREGIGYALQENVLFTGTIEENLRWGDEEASSEKIRKVSDIAQADPFVEKLPDRYETVLGQRGVNLSGGQKQRLCIARALMKDPKILILDDSTSAVDLTTEAKIQTALRNVFSEMTVFIVAQRISSVMDADKILVMENGNIIDSGTHNELISRCSVYREIVSSQLGEEAFKE